MMNTASSSDRYSDPRAFEEYEQSDGVETSSSILVDASPGDAFDAWLQHVWVGSAKELSPGVGRGLVGHARGAPMGVAERIVSVGLPSEDDASKIASVCYKVYAGGPFPVVPDSHIALVRFVPVENSQTFVLWTIKTTATPIGNVLCGGALFRLMLRSVIGYMLRSLKSHLASHTEGETKTAMTTGGA